MTQLTTVITHATGDVFPAGDWNTYIRDNLNYLITAGAPLASASTITWTNEYQRVTGSVPIQNISAGTQDGQPLLFLIQDGTTLQNNAGGTGNIRLSGLVDAQLPARAAIAFVWDASTSVWQETARLGAAASAAYATTVAALGIGAAGKLGFLRLMPSTYNTSGALALPAGTIGVGDLTEFPTAGSATTPNGTISWTGKSVASGAGNLTGCTGGVGTLAANAPITLSSGTPINTSYEEIGLTYDPALGKWVSPVTSFYGSSTSYVVSSAAFAEVGTAAAVAQAQPRIAWRKYDAAGLKPQLKWSLGWALNTVTPVGFTACPSFWGQDITVAMAGAAASIGPDTAAAGYVGPSSNGSMPYETLWGNIPGGYTLRDFLLLSLQAKVSAGNALVGGGDKLDAFLRWVG